MSGTVCAQAPPGVSRTKRAGLASRRYKVGRNSRQGQGCKTYSRWISGAYARCFAVVWAWAEIRRIAGRGRRGDRLTDGPMTVRPFKGCTISARDLQPTPCACCARGVQPCGGPCERDSRTGSHGVRRGGVDREKASCVVLVRPTVQAGTCAPWYRLRGRSPGAGRPFVT